MKIGILGTRGIPNQYGGFEQFAEYLAPGLVARGHEVWVYNSSTHPYKESSWQGVNIIHCYDPENKIGTAGQFVYDFNCIRDARLREFDVVLQLGYTSSSVWGPWLPENAVVFTNMDGLEWKRSKYNKLVQKYLIRAEEWAIKTSDVLIADSLGIRDYLQDTYHKHSEFIAYGAEPLEKKNPEVLNQWQLSADDYYLLVARMEPENHIEVILDGYMQSGVERPFVVIGRTENTYGKRLVEKYAKAPRVKFLGAIYDMDALNQLRHYCSLYFHGHSVGGTNPSLLEAMACETLIVAHNNPFNRAVLEEDGLYFDDAEGVCNWIREVRSGEMDEKKARNLEKIKTQYRWEQIIDRYEQVFIKHLERLRS